MLTDPSTVGAFGHSFALMHQNAQVAILYMQIDTIC